MNIEIFIVLGLILFIVVYNNKTTLQKFIISSDSSVNYLREKDYNFLVNARYGSDADPNILFIPLEILIGIKVNPS